MELTPIYEILRDSLQFHDQLTDELSSKISAIENHIESKEYCYYLLEKADGVGSCEPPVALPPIELPKDKCAEFQEKYGLVLP